MVSVSKVTIQKLFKTFFFQQEDLTDFGKLLLALACRSLIAVHPDNLATSIELMARTYSSDIRNLIRFVCVA